MIWPAQVLRACGYPVQVHHTVNDRSGLGVLVNNGVVVGVKHPQCDVIVLQRPTHRLYAQAVPFYQREGVRVVIEIDDDLAHVPARNEMFGRGHPRHSKDDNYHWLSRACRAADAVVCTTTKLAEMYGQQRARIVPNYVPARYRTFRQEPHPGPVRVGWAGNMEVHHGDLEAAGRGVARALEGTDATFVLVGAPEQLAHARAELAMPAARSAATGWFELTDYPQGLALLDVGLVPLAPGVFNEAKSWLKGLEYAMVGVPFVASDTEPYRALHQHGLGLIAAKPKHWTRAVRQLVTDASFRQDQADAAFAKSESLTLEANAWRFWEAWSGA